METFLIEKLQDIQKKFYELSKIINNTIIYDKEKYRKYKELEKIIKVYQTYKNKKNIIYEANKILSYC